ncbi:MAG: dipeptide ABC transporter ATP-binding protein [Spirochaetia bacterium]|nr:dipeptide ABC transporter ATP-binding protein [Spirochaetia bacterium]MCF7946728.1 dipeptide ABC transporter ATP-binding protein [Spirochaetia bacterium]MCF7952904.1 dipeptide ABC transporter ATP-binding protein [Spirochaetales bacterium]
MANKDLLLEVENLKKYFPYKNRLFKKKRYLHAVDDISFKLYNGETLGIVGESGCGKSTTGFAIAKLFSLTGGRILFRGDDLADLPEKTMRPFRQKIQMIFQDPFSSLNPRMTVSDIVSEPLVIHNRFKGESLRRRVQELLGLVGLSSYHADRYPHEFSGGQRQRIGIARALALNPELVICDEPISALDVSIQAQIVNLLQDLQQEFGLTYIFIAHDLSMVKYISDRIVVMYLGKIMETADSLQLYGNPQHPYTQALLSAVPEADPDKSKLENRIILQGSVPSPVDPASGCRFASRCPYCMPICRKSEPKLKQVGSEHYAACYLLE